jgi:hypothetical protein
MPNDTLTSHLFIGGPRDGEMHEVDTRMPYWETPIFPERPPYKFDQSPQDANAVIQIATYRRETLGRHTLYVHESLTLPDALDMVFDHYKY